MANNQAQNSNSAPAASRQNLSLIAKLAAKLGVNSQALLETLRNKTFRCDDRPLTDEELMTLLVVMNRYNLDPFLKQIYAFRGRDGSVIPVISIDGWISIMVNHPRYKGQRVEYSTSLVNLRGANNSAVPVPEWCKFTIDYRDGGSVEHVEYAVEAFQYRSQPWSKYPRRMLKHRACSQCIRYAFGISAFDVEDPDLAAAKAEAGSRQAPVQIAPAAPVAPAQPRFKALPPAQLETLLAKALQQRGPDELRSFVLTRVAEENIEAALAWLNSRCPEAVPASAPVQPVPEQEFAPADVPPEANFESGMIPPEMPMQPVQEVPDGYDAEVPPDAGMEDEGFVPSV